MPLLENVGKVIFELCLMLVHLRDSRLPPRRAGAMCVNPFLSPNNFLRNELVQRLRLDIPGPLERRWAWSMGGKGLSEQNAVGRPQAGLRGGKRRERREQGL